MLLCRIFLHLSFADMNSASFLIAYLIQIFTNNLLNATRIYVLNTILSPRTYAPTLVSTYGAAALILSALNAYLLRVGWKITPPFGLPHVVWASPTTLSYIGQWRHQGRGESRRNCSRCHCHFHRHRQGGGISGDGGEGRTTF